MAKNSDKKSGKSVKKSDLPTKICACCKREMVWRKKWEKNWDNVLYCSDACREGRYKPN